ncbi:hypothetical protein [Azonexus hydrophilus]|uniref:Carrier domain-containing protein n=1 Tax=Azonexus hydrophilus TaxID=418702 RepID=A0ABZ2XG42_9RHOO
MDELEIIELAIAVLGLPADFDDEDAVERKINNRFDVDLETFGRIASALLPFAMTARSPLTEKVYQGFAHNDCWLAKKEVKS